MSIRTWNLRNAFSGYKGMSFHVLATESQNAPCVWKLYQNESKKNTQNLWNDSS